MAAPLKIGVIGAGSATFSLALVRDICLRDALAGSRVVMMDVDRERLALIHRFAVRYAAELGVDVAFGMAAEREPALRGADFVINTALVGGHGAYERVRDYCEAQGYYRGMRVYDAVQVRLMLEVARDMERLCPDAWLLQAANPLPEGCTAMTRESSVRVCGLCHGHYGYRRIAEVLGLDPDAVSAQSVGINHIIYMTHFEHEGRDAYPLLDRWIEERSEEFWRDYEPAFYDNQISPAAVEQYRLYGLMPIGDTPRRGGWWFHTDLETKRRWYRGGGGFDSEVGWAEYLEGLRQKVAGIHRAARDESARLTELYPPEPSREQHVPLIDALANDNRVELQVNVPNDGAIEGIPDDVVVEVPALCSARGIQPLHVGPLPDTVMLNSIWPRILRMERMVAFAFRPDWRMLLYAVLDDHRTRSWDRAVEFCRGLMELSEFSEISEVMSRNAPVPPPWEQG